MRDIIDERDEKERISKSIVKFWNVNYIPTPYAGTDTVEDNSDDKTCMLREEIQDEKDVREELYNATTRSYSGAYGAEEVSDEMTKGRISRILQEKDEALRNLIEENSGDYYWEEE